ATEQDFNDMIARLKAAPLLIDQTIELLRKGLAKGLTPPRITLRDVPDQVSNQLIADAAKNPLMRSFEKFPKEIPEAEQKHLQEQAWSIVSKNLLPAYQRLLEFLRNEYLPKSRETIAMAALPDGQAWYAYNAHRSTTTDLTPKQIHEMGR